MICNDRRQEIYGIQILRAVAAMAVVLHHTLEEAEAGEPPFSPDWLTTAGAAGVDIFFVVSGFIILYTSFSPLGGVLSPKDFLFRRITRIYPLYWFCCIAVLALRAMGLFRNHQWGLGDVVGSFLLLPGQSNLITVGWTLTYELYFYVVFACTLPLRSLRASAIITTVVIVGVTASGQIAFNARTNAFAINPIPIEFCAGLWLAFLSMTRKSKLVTLFPAITAAVVGVGALVAAPLVIPHLSTAGLTGWGRVLAWGVPSTMIVSAFLRVAHPRTIPLRLAVLLGNASYAIYLTHVFVMVAYARLLAGHAISASPVLVVPIVTALAVTIGVSVHLYLESPILRIIRRYGTAGESRQKIPSTDLLLTDFSANPLRQLPPSSRLRN